MAFVFFFVIFVAVVILFLIGWRGGRKRINDVFLGNTAALGRWEYTPEEWKKFSEDYFPWVKNKDLAGIFSISDETILISNGQDEFFLDLIYRHVPVHIEYDNDRSIFHIKLKKVKSSHKGVTIYYDDYTELQIPLPSENAEKANHVVEQFHQIAKEKFEATKGMASSDLIFAQFLNNRTQKDISESEADEKIH